MSEEGLGDGASSDRPRGQGQGSGVDSRRMKLCEVYEGKGPFERCSEPWTAEQGVEAARPVRPKALCPRIHVWWWHRGEFIFSMILSLFLPT